MALLPQVRRPRKDGRVARTEPDAATSLRSFFALRQFKLGSQAWQPGGLGFPLRLSPGLLGKDRANRIYGVCLCRFLVGPIALNPREAQRQAARILGA